MNLMEAFKALDQLNEDVFSVDAEGIKKLNDFMQNDDSVDELSVFDIDSTEDDVIRDDEECNEGDMILDCCVCHSKVFKPASEIVVDEESQIANAGEECPYCFSVEGYKIVGEVKASGEEEASADEEVSESGEDTDKSESDVAAKGSTWEEFISNLEEENDVKVDSAYRNKYTGEKIIFYKDGKSFEGEVTEYFNGSYELMNYNVHEIPSENDVKEDSSSDEVKLETDVAEEVSDASISDLDSDEEADVQESVKDRIIKCRMKDARICESVDLLTKDNTIASLLRDNMDKLSGITDVNELRDAIMDLVNESDIANKPAALKLKRDLYSKKSVGALLSTIGTYMTGEKVIKMGRNLRRSRKESIKNRRIIEESEDIVIPDPYDKQFVLSTEDVTDLVGKEVKLIAALNRKDADDDFTSSFYLTDDPECPVIEITRDSFGHAEETEESDEVEDSLKESSNHRKNIKEDLDTIRITDDDIVISMSNDESEDKEEKEEEVKNTLTIEPVSEESKEQIDFNSIDRESAEDAIEESLKESFGNVKFFRCSNIVPRNNRFIVEGVIGFNSGRKRNTNFVFKPRKITESKVIFKGYSKELKESVKSMSLVCRNRGKKCIAESLKVSK